jgi:site-specific DNA-methyltransferase (adenine-specific)
MGYTIQDLPKTSAAEKKISKFLTEKNIKVGKSGLISDKVYHELVDYLSPDKEVYVLNGNKIKVKSSPYYESGNKRISIFKDDAVNFLENLPDNSVDIIVTDPAYSGMNQKLKLGSGKIIGKYKDAGKDGAKWFEEFHDTEENYKTFLEQCLRVMKNNRHIYIMFDSYSLLTLGPIARQVFEVKNLLCWDKANIGLGHYFRRRHEFILFASKGKRPLNSKNIPDVWKIKRVVGAKYPTQKPTEVYELMLKGSAEKDFVVCDPFLGSGSAAIAAIKANCKFIGCDISDKSMEYSKDRIEHFLKEKKDKYQKQSLLSNDEALAKLFTNGKTN